MRGIQQHPSATCQDERHFASSPPIAIELLRLDVSSDVRCIVRIIGDPHASKPRMLSASGRLSRANQADAKRADTRDCIEDVVEDLMTRQVIPLMNQPAAASTTSNGSAGSALSRFPLSNAIKN
jgi:hypothetical protein